MAKRSNSQPAIRRRYIIIGAGAVGGTIGGRLAQAGHEVILVARGGHLQSLQQSGLELIDPVSRSRLAIPSVAGPRDIQLTTSDVLILAVKSQDTQQALDLWADQPVAGTRLLAGECLPLFSAQNGVENERVALRRFASVYGICVWLPAVHLQPGTVVVRSAPVSGVFVIGRFPKGNDDLAHSVGRDLAAANFGIRQSTRVMRWKYGKLLRNLVNAIDALILPGVDSTSLLEHTVSEARQVLACARIRYSSPEQEEKLRAQINISHPVPGLVEAGSSSWQSLARGSGSIEADYLNGEIVFLGRHCGVPTPFNIALQRMANQAAREGAEPRSFTIEQVLLAVHDELNRAA